MNGNRWLRLVRSWVPSGAGHLPVSAGLALHREGGCTRTRVICSDFCAASPSQRVQEGREALTAQVKAELQLPVPSLSVRRGAL